MSLTSEDLQAIREIVQDEVAVIVRSTLKEELAPTNGEIEARQNDIKDICDMIAGCKTASLPISNLRDLVWRRSCLRLNSELLAAAKQVGITLPR